ncbi:MAG: hypothetical protein IKI31_05535 [Treponema sp.]|nr:hypothetical protein [Treponema sp.]
MKYVSLPDFLVEIVKQYANLLPSFFDEKNMPLVQSLAWDLLQDKKICKEIKKARKEIEFVQIEKLTPLQKLIFHKLG